MRIKILQFNRATRTALLALLLSLLGATKAYAEEFIATSPSGHEIKYQIISSDAKTVRTIRYRYNNDQLYIYHGNLVIPSTVTYQNEVYSVIEIGSYTFMDQTLLTSVEIPGSVTTIGYDAFKNCTGLTGTLTIGENIVSIGGGAFNNTNYSTLNYNARRMCTNENGDVCNYAAPMQDHVNGENGWLGNCASLTTINIGEHVEVIPARAFCYCHFTGELTIPNSVTVIGPNAFYHCQQLTGTLTIPESVLRIGDGAFCFCDGLTTLNFNAANYDGDCSCYYGYFPDQAYGENKWFGSCPLLKTLQIGEAVTIITPELFKGCRFEGEIVIPNSVTSIGYDAFTNCTGITEVTIGEGVASLGTAFKNCTSLATIHYNAINCADFGYNYNGVNYTFTNCDALRTLTIGDNVQTIPGNSFAYTSLTDSINIPNSVTEIGGGAFTNCSNITAVTIGEGLTKTNGQIFSGCTGLATVNYNSINCTNWNTYETWKDCTSLDTLFIGTNVESIPNGIFKDCSFACNLVLPNSLLTIGENAFQNCSGFTGDLIIPENVTTIGDNAFNGCSGFTGYLTIGNSVETIGELAFQNCTGLTGTLTIGEAFDHFTGIWGCAFENCSGLTTLNYNATSATLGGWYWLRGCSGLTTLNIGSNVQAIPAEAFKDLNFSNAIVIPNSVTTIGYQAFYDCDRIKNITIGEGVTSLAGGAISYCDSLTTIHYNAINCNVGNTTIGSGWLSLCPMATTLTIGEHVQSIFKGAFSKRDGRSFTGNLTLPSSLQTIGEEAFLDCTGLTGSLVIPNSVTSIGKKAFSGCTGFTGNLTISNNVTVIDEQTFYGCNGFAGTLTIGSSVETIGYEAFRGCSSFTDDLNIPNSVVTLGRYCFYDCSGFDGTLTIGEGVVNINEYAPFGNCSSLTAINYNATNAIKPDWGNWLSGCNALTTLTIGSNVESIFESAFDGKSSLTGNLVIPNSVTTIGKNAFKGCSGFNGTLTLSNNLTSIGEAAFKDCYGFIGSLTLPNSLTTINKEVFRNCHSFTGDLVIPNTVLTIGDDAFRDCYSMDGVITVGTGVTSIGQGAFQNCNKITTLNYNAINATVTNDSWISYCSQMTTLNFGNQVQSIPADAFKNKTNFTGSLTLPSSLTSIGDYAFYHDRYFTGDLVIPSGVTVIGQYAFEECQGFTGTLTLPATMTSIGEAAFKNCYNFTGSLAIPAGLSTIEKEAFREMRSLTGDLVIPNSVVEIKQQAFINCRSLNGTLTLSSSLESIGQEAFQDCNSLTGDLTLPSSLTTIGIRAFKWCRGFTGDLVIPNTVTSLGEGAFYECYRFDGSLTLPNALEVISYEAFRGCYGLTGDLVIPASVTSINDAAFYNCSGFTGQLVIGESVETLNYDGFNRASNFASVKVKRNVPPTITNSNVFGYWDKTKPVYIPCGTTEAYQAADYWSDFTNYQEQPMIDLFVASDDESMGTAAITQQPTCDNNQATVTATANTGYMFSNWTENNEVVSTSNPYTFSLTTARNLVAHFEGVTYTITVTANPTAGGSVTGAGGYGEGATATLTATANTGYTFINWTKGGVEVSNNPSYSFTVTESGAYVANFSLNSYEITASADPAAGGTVTGDNTYDYGTVATLTATANTGYTFVNWTKGGVEVSTDASYSFTVTEDGAYVAHFSLNSYTIVAAANPAAHGTVTGAGSYNYGATCTLAATPGQGYRFVSWTENNVEVSTTATYTFTVTGARTLVANFEEITNHWTPIGGTQYNMTISGIILIDGVEQTVTTLEIGAFCGDECRGSMLPEFFPPTNQYVVSLTVVSNVQNGEAITFRLYDHALGQELDLQCANSITFQNNNIIGDVGNWFQFAFNSDVSVSVTLNPEGAGTVTGTGNYTPGTEVTLTATANEGYAFNNWSVGGETVSTENPYTFTVTAATQLVAHFNRQQTASLPTGWSWWSTYIEMSGNNGLQQLEESLGHNGLMIKTQNPYVQNYYPSLGYDYWFGSLTNVGITNEAGYQINVSNSCDAVVTGAAAVAADHPITIQSGWNWIGYPVTTQQSLSNALSSYTPAANDLIKGQSTSATYYANYGWFPTSFVLTPGQGYMYYSNATGNKTLTYAESRGDYSPVAEPQCVWTNNVHAHASNLTVMATITIDGEEQQSDELELGAFVEGECRGSAVLRYFEPTNRWYAMLTILGEEGEDIGFAVIDRRRGTVNAKTTNRLTYSENAIVGSLDSPYEVHFAGASTLNIYPNPTAPNSGYTLDIPMEETIAEVVVYDMQGCIITHETGAQAHVMMQGIAVPGIYMVKAICRSGNVYEGRLVVK